VEIRQTVIENKSAEAKAGRLDAAPTVVDFKPISMSCEATFQPAQKARNTSSTWVRLDVIMEKVIVQFAARSARL
jgi:hypothetical protein